MNDTFKNISIEKQESITSAALAEFAEHGYREASTNRLVKELGISKGSLFKYFTSKLDLYSYLVDTSLNQLILYMDSFIPLENGHLKDNIIAYAAYEYDYLINYPSQYRFFYQFIKDLNNPELATIKDSLLRRSLQVSHKLMSQINMPEASGLRDHILLIISSYNQLFIDHMNKETNWAALKTDYLTGLSKHLNYVDWRLK